MARKAGADIKVSNQGNDDGFSKVGGGGPWKGNLWYPMPPTAKAVDRAKEFGNEIVTAKQVTGILSGGKAFNRKDVYFIQIKGQPDLLFPDHGGLMADCEEAVRRYGEGCEVRVEYTGTAPLKGGKYEGNDCHTYDVRARAAKV